MIENIDFGKNSPSAFVFNVTMIMSDWTLICDDRVRLRILATAATLFPQIQNSFYLAKFPLVLVLLLLGRFVILFFILIKLTFGLLIV